MNRTFQVFRTGTHTDSSGVERTFTAEHLRAIADKFNPDTGAAPIVKGHPATDDPAFGWVDRFLFEETSGILYAVPKQVDQAFAEDVRAGRFSRVSIALYPPTAKNNPVPGMYYPRHVGFLGAASPAVTGLKAANFNADNEGFLMFDLNDDKQTSKFSEVIATAFTAALVKLGFKPGEAIQSTLIEGNVPDPKASTEYKELETQRLTMETQFNDEKKARLALEQKVARAEIAAFTETQITEGRLSPAEGLRMTEILFALEANAGAEIEFAEGEGAEQKTVKAKPASLLRDIITGLPKRIEFGEIAGKSKDGLSSIGFTAPEGALVSGGERIDLHRRATAYAEEHKVDYLDAVSIVSRGQ